MPHFNALARCDPLCATFLSQKVSVYHCYVIRPEIYQIRWNYAAVGAITPFKVIQGHRFWYQSKILIAWVGHTNVTDRQQTDRRSKTCITFAKMLRQTTLICTHRPELVRVSHCFVYSNNSNGTHDWDWKHFKAIWPKRLGLLMILRRYIWLSHG